MLISAGILPNLSEILTKHAPSTGYSVPMLAYGFATMFAHWTPREFEAFCRQEIPAPRAPNIRQMFDAELPFEQRKSLFWHPCAKNLLLVSASTVPSAAFQDVILSLLLPLRVTQRPAHNLYPLFLDLREDLRQTAPELASRWEILAPDHDDDALAQTIARHDALSVSGSDQTIKHYETLANALSPKPVFIPHGHRISAAILRKSDLEKFSDPDLANLALDASLWDQTGCLSPKCLFIESDDPSLLREIAQKLVHYLDLLAADLPAIPPDPAESASRNSAMLMSLFDGPELFRATKNNDLILLWPAQATFAPLLYPRTLNLWPVPDALTAAEKLAPHGQALASRTTLSSEDQKRLSASGYNYFCHFGKMQDPPLTWFHDGLGTLRPLFLA